MRVLVEIIGLPVQTFIGQTRLSVNIFVQENSRLPMAGNISVDGGSFSSQELKDSDIDSKFYIYMAHSYSLRLMSSVLLSPSY